MVARLGSVALLCQSASGHPAQGRHGRPSQRRHHGSLAAKQLRRPTASARTLPAAIRATLCTVHQGAHPQQPVRAARRCWSVFAVATLLLAGCGGMPAPGDVAGFAAWLDQADALRERHDVVGAQIAWIRSGRLTRELALGHADAATERAVQPDTLFQAASVSKPVAAWGVMRAVEQDRLELDAPVEQYLKRWQLPASDYDHAGVTVRRLLGHTAGLSLGGYPGLSPTSPLPSLEESLSGATGGVGDVRVIMPPGHAWRYSGGGYTLLQLALEEVTGERFAAYLRREVLVPLGMNDSYYARSPDVDARMAQGHNALGDRLPNYRYAAAAAAGLVTTASDLARFLLAQGQGPDGEAEGRGVLSPAMVQLLRTPTKQSGGRYGLGVVVERAGGWTFVGHGGANAGWRSIIMGLPDRGDGIVVLTNSDKGAAFGTDVMCAWARATTTVAPPRCEARFRERNLGVLITSVLAAAVGGFVLWLGRKLRARHRLWGLDRRRWGRRVAAGCVVAVVAVAWRLFWHTDLAGRIAMGRAGDVVPDPVAPFGPLISWLFVLGCALVVAALLGTRAASAQSAER